LTRHGTQAGKFRNFHVNVKIALGLGVGKGI
jgi:hypothetical protein